MPRYALCLIKRPEDHLMHRTIEEEQEKRLAVLDDVMETMEIACSLHKGDRIWLMNNEYVVLESHHQSVNHPAVKRGEKPVDAVLAVQLVCSHKHTPNPFLYTEAE